MTMLGFELHYATLWMLLIVTAIVMEQVQVADDDDESKSSLKLPLFDGKQSSWKRWWWCFWAYAGLKGFQAAVGTQGEAMLPAKEKLDYITDDDTDNNKKLAARK